MIRRITIISVIFTLVFSQGKLSSALGSAKDKLKKVEKEIKDNAALLAINTPSNFDGVRQDMNKVFNIQKVNQNTISRKTYNENRSKSGWIKFGSIGENNPIEKVQSDWTQKLKAKSFGKRTYTRGYKFDVVVNGQTTNCDCESATDVKGLIYWKWFKRYTDYVECEVTSPDGKVSKIMLEYSQYKEKIPLTKKIASKLLPEDMRDSGFRTKITGKLKSAGENFDISTTYEYDLAFLGDKSPISLIQPPVGYYVSSSASGEYFAVKDPSKFRISKSVTSPKDKGKYYSALLAAYFYYPHSQDFRANKGHKKGALFAKYNKLEGKMRDHFYDAKFRGAFGLF